MPIFFRRSIGLYQTGLLCALCYLQGEVRPNRLVSHLQHIPRFIATITLLLSLQKYPRFCRGGVSCSATVQRHCSLLIIYIRLSFEVLTTTPHMLTARTCLKGVRISILRPRNAHTQREQSLEGTNLSVPFSSREWCGKGSLLRTLEVLPTLDCP